MTRALSRRRFLEIAGVAGGGLMMRESLINHALAASPEPHFLVMVYFNGGWDQLIALDPRDQRVAKFKPTGAANPTSGIYPSYAEYAAADPAIAALMGTGTGTLGIGNNIQVPSTASNLSFGPAIPPSVLTHAADLALVRGVSMDTLTHQVGMRFFLTGKFPRGLAASGSSLDTVVSAQSAAMASMLDLPNLVLKVESYNEGAPAFATGISVGSSADMMTVLMPQAQTPVLRMSSEALLETFESAADSCEAQGYDVAGLVRGFRDSQAQSRRMTNGVNASAFDFGRAISPETAATLRAFGIRETSSVAAPFNGSDLAGPLGRAAIAGQALTRGLSQVVSVSLATGLDDHNDIYDSQSTTQRLGWDALGRLLAFLKTKEVSPGVSYYQRTTLLVFSEFARTPLVNSRDGRDHHLTNSCLIKGPGIVGNRVFGASSDTGMNAQKWNPRTGVADAGTNGRVIRPADIHATLLRSMGLSHTHLSNQSPSLLSPLLKSS